MSQVTNSGPTQTAKTEIHAERWTARPGTARVLRVALFVAPLVVSLLVSFWAARNFPPERVQLNRWIWWLGLAVMATTIVRILERAIARVTPIAMLFQLSLVFPDQAPSRFSMALRAGSARSLQRRLDTMKERGDIFTTDDTYAQQMLDLIRMLSEHDRMTRGHAERVRAYSELIGAEMGLDADELDKLRWGALLHDMGKLDVPSEILNKPGRPTDEEWKILQTHPAAALPYLVPLKNWLGDWVHAADCHHERWDGGGYPLGLAGARIPLSGRIVAVADAFDVMTSTRSYKQAMPLELGRQEVADKAGSQFDPEVARAFMRVSLGDVRRAAGPLAWFTSLPGLQNLPIGAASSQAITTLTAATAVAVGGVGGLVSPPQPPAPPPAVVAFVEEASFDATDISIDEDTTGTIVVTMSGGAPYSVDLSRIPDGAVAVVGTPVPTDDGKSVAFPVSFTPALNSSGSFRLKIAGCAADTCLEDSAAIEVRPVNDPPTIALRPMSVNRGDDLTIPLIDIGGAGPAAAGRVPGIYVADVDGDRLTIIDVTEVVGGSTSFSPEAVVFRHDRSTNPSSQFVVTLTDGTVTIDQLVTIVVVNTNSSPRLVVGNTSVSDQTATGEVLFRLVATDVDGDPITYELDDTDGVFVVEPLTGNVTLAAPLDAAVTSRYTITVTASDSWGDSTTSTFTVFVVSDNAPPKLSIPSSLSVRENSSIGTFVGRIGATDADADSVTFSLSRTSGAFAIDSTTGRITTTSSIDHESTPQIAVVVTARDSRGALASQTLAIDITDVNEAPIVSAPNFAILVSEEAAVGTPLGVVEATDPEGDVLTFTLPAAVTVVNIDSKTGQITLAEKVDFETTGPIEFTVTVTDSGSPILSIQHVVRIVVRDVNEPATIDSSPVRLPENSTVGSVVGRVTATDPENAALEFALTSPSSRFSIDKATGDIVLTAPVDYETVNSYTLNVSVSDGVNTSTRSISVFIDDVNEAPAITPGQDFYVDETAPLGVDFGTVAAADPEGAPFAYAITAGNTNGDIEIDPSTGALRAVNALDFEMRPIYTLTVEITESGPDALVDSETVTVRVTDGSEPPVLDDQLLSIAENSPPGSSAGSVAATDPDAGSTLTFSITGGNGAGDFQIDASTGEITIAAGQSVDYEGPDNPYSLTVEVTDGIFIDDGIVTVDVTDVDEAPEITSPAFAVFIDEQWSAPDVTTVFASDPEGDAVTFSIAGGNTDNTFAIDPSSGLVTVVGTLDHETNPSFALDIEAVQNSDPSLVGAKTINIVVTDVDEAPEISSAAAFSILESATVGDPAHSVLASDPEGELLTYSLTGAPFAIDGTGAVTVSGPLDFESATSYTATLTVSDEADPSVESTTQTITITVGDVNEAPEFDPAPPSLTVPENSAIGTVVGSVIASDPDAGDVITYSMSGGPFLIDSITGEISVNGPLDYETTGSYGISVTITDDDPTTPLSTSAPFTITVGDVNEAPTVAAGQSWTINEADPVGTTVGTVAVVDPDVSPSYSFAITNGDPTSAFAIDSGGVITVAGSLDYETMPAPVALEITLTDGPFVVVETVDVTVQDGPEPPVLTLGTDFFIDENSALGTIYADADATDPDVADVLVFSIVGPNPGGIFAIDSVTGEIKLGDLVDYESITDYPTTVRVSDGTYDIDQSITLHINDVNEAPVIALGQAFDIVENDVDGTAVTVAGAATPVTVSDVDAGDTISGYSITGGTGAGLFAIDASGQITKSGTLDFNATQSYTLEVTAVDSGIPALSDVENVTINVASRFGAGLSPFAGQVIFNEVLYEATGSFIERAELVNTTGAPIDISNWVLTDVEPGTSETRSFTNSFPGPTSIDEDEYLHMTWLAPTLGASDDLWIFDDSGLLVAYMAWGDETAPSSEILSRPPLDVWSIWEPTYEISLGGAPNGQSISRNPDRSGVRESACWEPTTSGDAIGRCSAINPTFDSDGGAFEVSSFGEPNNAALLISELAVDGMHSGGNFVEIYNVSDVPQPLGGVQIQIADRLGFTENIPLGPVGPVIAPKAHLLIAQAGSPLAASADALFFVPITNEYGIRIRQSGVVHDQVGNAPSVDTGAAPGFYREGTGLADPLVQAGFDQSFERLNAYGAGNCMDTGDNAADFTRNFAPGSANPQNLASPVEPCGPPPPVPGPADHLIISEYRTDGPGSGTNEFIEFFNPKNTPINLANYELHDETGLVYSFPSMMLMSGEYWLVRGPGYVPGPDASYAGVTNGNSWLQIFDGTTLIDEIRIGSGSDPLPRTFNRYEATWQRRASGCADFAQQDLNYEWRSTPTPTMNGDGPSPCP